MNQENSRKLTRGIFKALNRSSRKFDTIRDILGLIKKHRDIEAVGIRLREGHDG